MEKEIIRKELYHVQKKFHRMRIDKLTSILFSDLPVIKFFELIATALILFGATINSSL